MVTETFPTTSLTTEPISPPIEALDGSAEAPPSEASIAPSPEAVAPAPVAPPSQPSEAAIRQQLEALQAQREGELRVREQRIQQQEDTRVLSELQAKIAAQLEQRYGMASEQAAEVAAQQTQLMYQSYQQSVRAEQMVQAERSKVQLATQLAQAHGVPVHVLMSATSPQEMQAMAQRQKEGSALQVEVAALRAELAKVKRGQVPTQNFAGPVSAVPGNLSETDLEKAVAKGLVAMTPAISARLNKYWNS